MDRKIGTGTKLFYGLGSFGYGSIGQTMGSFLMFFGTGVLEIPGILMGIALAASTLWDATTDPFVGHFSDNTKSRLFGKRHGWILFGCIAVAITNLLIWSISPLWPVLTKFFVLLGLLLVYETFCTVYSTPYGALGLDLSKSYNERTAVQGYKTIFSFLSLLVPSLLMGVFLSPNKTTGMNSSNTGYQNIAIITSSLCIICGLIAFTGTFKHKTLDKKDMPPGFNNKNIFADFFGIIGQKNVARLIAGYAVSLGAGAFLTSLGMHVFTYTFQFSANQISTIMVCLIGGIVLGQPFWFWISRKTDKINALLCALATILTGMAVFSIVIVFRNCVSLNTTLLLTAVTIFVCGAGTGCLYSLPISMYADCIFLNRQKTGIDKTAKSAGFLTFCTKISNAVIMFIIGLSLDLVGFIGNKPVQSVSTQNWLGWLLIAGVVCASVTAMFIYSKYSYSKKDFICK